MVSKLIITCSFVNFLVVLCLAATTKEIQNPNDSVSQTPINSETENLDLETVLKQILYYLPMVEEIIADPTKIGSLISKKLCTSKNNENLEILNGSLKFLFEKYITKKKELLSNLHISQLPKLEMYDDKINISELTFKNIAIKGLENMVISKFNFNVCALYSDVEMNIPKLEITSTYTLKGIINRFPVLGNGEIIVTVDMLKLQDQSSMSCDLITFMDNTCTLSYPSETENTITKKVTVRMTNIKYRNLTESQINHKINNFIRDYDTSNKMVLMQEIVKLAKNCMKTIMDNFSLASLFGHLSNEINLG